MDMRRCSDRYHSRQEADRYTQKQSDYIPGSKARQIEAARIAMTRFIKRTGRIWIRIFPDKPITKKPAETRMGKGKGHPEDWVSVIRPGRILYEMEGVPEERAREAFLLASHKLPIHTKFIMRGSHL